jgi:tellurite resistance-related uncharacterized protein
VTVEPYRTTPVFDETSLPAGLRRDHCTKAGVWGLVRVLEGKLRLVFRDTGEDRLLEPGRPGLLEPEHLHWVEPVGAMKMRVEFYAAPPTSQ